MKFHEANQFTTWFISLSVGAQKPGKLSVYGLYFAAAAASLLQGLDITQMDRGPVHGLWRY
jgi:hypothetical protein